MDLDLWDCFWTKINTVVLLKKYSNKNQMYQFMFELYFKWL